MQLRAPSPWRRRTGWLLLAQLLWIPLLLLPGNPWSRQAGSRPPAGEALPPAPSHFGPRSRPPSLGELLAPTALGGRDPGHQGSGVDPSTPVLLNRPRTAADSNAAPQGPRNKGMPTASKRPDGLKPAATALVLPSQQLGGSLGLEELRGAADRQSGGGSAGSGAGGGKPSQP